MIKIDIDQGSQEWFEARCGVITASNFHKLVTSTGKETSGETRKTYLYTIAAEIISGDCEESYTNVWMERGKDIESEARKILSLDYMTVIKETGFCFLDDNRRVGCSPDGLIETGVGVEIKCPKGSTHVGYLTLGKLPVKYIQQIQGSLWVTGYDTWIFMSYNRNMKPLIIEVKRDKEYIKKLSESVLKAVDEVDEIVSRIKLKK